MSEEYAEFKYEPLDSTRSEIRLIRLHVDNSNTFDGAEHSEESPQYQASQGIEDADVTSKLSKGSISEATKGEQLLQPPRHYQRGEGSEIEVKTLKYPSSFELQLETFPLHSAPPYTALSYVWGAPERSHRIICNDKALYITHNLKKALRCLVITGGWLWADAICINQSDVLEKNSQVALMKDIYTCAAQVMAFIADPPGDLGVETLQAIMWHTDDLATYKAGGSAPTLSKSMLWGTQTWTRVVSHHWFSRAWTIQEAVLNRTFSIIYGNAAIEFELLSSMLRLGRGVRPPTKYTTHSLTPSQVALLALDNRPSEVAKSTRNGYQVYAIAELRDKLHLRSQKVALITALTHGYRTMATDPRDKVYAFLGLARQEAIEELRPDYSPFNSLDNTLITCARYLVALGTAIAIGMLAEVGFIREGLPSWVNDWEDHSQERGPACFHDYACAIQTPANLFVSPLDPLALSVDGVICDRIQVTWAGYHDCVVGAKTIRPQTPEWYAYIMATDFFMGECSEMYETVPYPTGETVEEVVWRTMTCDHIGSHFARADRTHGRRCFAAFIRTRYEPGYAPYFAPYLSNEENVEALDETTTRQLADDYELALKIVHPGRRGVFTASRYLALVPDTCEVDDVLTIIYGAPLPFVLRPLGNGRFRLMGGAYVHGWMDGEMIELDEQTQKYTVNGQEAQSLLLV